MKKLVIVILLSFLLSWPVIANDGVFYAQGNTLIPLQETQVELRKEVLKFYLVDHNFAKVDVYFEFFNPGPTKTVTVGFVTPPAEGDISEQAAKKPFISAFTVDVNGRKLPFKIKRLRETTFNLEKKEDDFDKSDYFVYYFPVTFKKGLNIIRHTYRYRGGESVETDRDFSYQITTGKAWANKRIDDFELQIHPDHGIFYLPARFVRGEKTADWEIAGDGVIEEKVRNPFGEESPQIRLAHLNRGYFLFKAENFKPDFDISFGEYNWAAGWTKQWCGVSAECAGQETLDKIARFFSLNPESDPESVDFEELAANDFKYLRNYFYAVRGLDFQDQDLRRFFGRFFWYKPDKMLKAENIKLSRAEDLFLKRIREIELKKRN
jgi:hypothetical protein